MVALTLLLAAAGYLPNGEVSMAPLITLLHAETGKLDTHRQSYDSRRQLVVTSSGVTAAEERGKSAAKTQSPGRALKLSTPKFRSLQNIVAHCAVLYPSTVGLRKRCLPPPDPATGSKPPRRRALALSSVCVALPRPPPARADSAALLRILRQHRLIAIHRHPPLHPPRARSK